MSVWYLDGHSLFLKKLTRQPMVPLSLYHLFLICASLQATCLAALLVCQADKTGPVAARPVTLE